MLQKSTNQQGLMATLWLPPGYILFGLHLRITNEPNTLSHYMSGHMKFLTNHGSIRLYL